MIFQRAISECSFWASAFSIKIARGYDLFVGILVSINGERFLVRTSKPEKVYCIAIDWCVAFDNRSGCTCLWRWWAVSGRASPGRGRAVEWVGGKEKWQKRAGAGSGPSRLPTQRPRCPWGPWIQRQVRNQNSAFGVFFDNFSFDFKITILFRDFKVDASKVLRLPRQSWAEAYGLL